MATDYNDFEALRPQLLGLARALCRRLRAKIDPEDVVQTVLTEIFAKLESGHEIKNPKSYANQALKNRILDAVRRHAHQYEQPFPESREGDPWEPGDPRSLDPAADPELKELFEQLEPGERCFLWRVVFEQRSVPEAQRMCGWPEKSPYFHLRKLLERVRPLLGLPDKGDGR